MPVEYHAQLPFLSGQLQILLPSDFSHNCLTRDPFPHSHPRFEAHYILCGQCTLVTDAQTLPCPSGHILILPPYLTHRIIPEASDTRTLSFLYTPDTESRFPPGCTLFPAAPQLIGLFSQGEEVIQAGVENLRIEIIGQLFYASFMIYHSMMTGAGHTKMVLFSSFVNCILVRAVLAVILSSIPGLGATGVYLACLIAPASSIPIGAAYIRRGRWRKSLVS